MESAFPPATPPATSPRTWAQRNSFREAYHLGALLGRGTFGHVYACTDRTTGEELACKMVLKSSLESPEEWQYLETEVEVMRLLENRHPSLVQLRETVENSRAMYLVMEHCRGGDLFELLEAEGKLPEAACKVIFHQLASALSVLHSLNILHRDVKPENVLLDRPADSLYCMTSAKASDIIRGHKDSPVVAKLADFGLSTVLKPSEKLKGTVGSWRFSSPEELSGTEYGTPADVWSLGVVLYAMLSESLPFSGRDPEDREGLREAILKGKLKFGGRMWSGVSDEAKDLVRKMLQLDAAKRPTAAELLQHPWLQAAVGSDDMSEGSDSESVMSGPLVLMSGDSDVSSECSDSESVMSAPESQEIQSWASLQHTAEAAAAKNKGSEEAFHFYSWLNVVCW